MALALSTMAAAQDFGVQTTVDPDPVSAEEPIQIRFNRPLTPNDGRLAVFVASTDVTDLFQRRVNGLALRRGPFRLPPGESDLIVYLVTPKEGWRELQRVRLNVIPPGGPQRALVEPKLSIGLKAQVFEGHSPVTNRPPRETFQDGTFQAAFNTDHLISGVGIKSEFQGVGSTYRQEAPRFADEGSAADKADLSRYAVDLQYGLHRVGLGHLSYGNHRHLISNYGGRGINFATRIGARSDLALTAMSATQIVGFQNFTGLGEANHRLWGLTYGHELMPGQGALRVEVSMLDGRRSPQSNFNQSSVTDAEHSRGFGLRILSTAIPGLRIDAGYAKSSFDNPFDPLLAAGQSLVPTTRKRKDAHYLDAAYALFKDYALTDRHKVNVTLNFRHERIDPQYRTIAAIVQADRLVNYYDITGTLGDVAFQYFQSRTRDNLDDVPSILKTKTPREGANIALPLNPVFGYRDSPLAWLPTLTYSYDRTHQFGLGLPINSGFALSHVPDQWSGNHNAGFEWAGPKWRLGYRVGYSKQDNRQTGRALADLANLGHVLSVGLQPWDTFDFSIEGGMDRAQTYESAKTLRTRRIGFNANWRVTERWTLGSTLNFTRGNEGGDLVESRSDLVQAQATYGFKVPVPGWRALPAQWYVRYVNQLGFVRDDTIGINAGTHLWTVSTGVSVSLW
ncbi:MAG TPA: hypothetical protein VED01_02310 [Burkholderiales bacterium]|nr:hypothetical protein [Burkholderiales bacterium]